MHTHDSVGQLPTISTLLWEWFQYLDRLTTVDLGEVVTNGLIAIENVAHDAIRIELWQPWGRCASWFHNVSKDIYILAVACYWQHQPSAQYIP